MNFLETILAHKRDEVAAKKRKILRVQLEDMPKFSYRRLSLISALQDRHLAIIGEIRRTEPSRKELRKDFEPLALAREYLKVGASALSVLTDYKFFQGHIDNIDRIRHFVSVPILRRDYVIDTFQLYETKACGADAVLLIAAALDPYMLHDLFLEARELGLECLVEVHNEEEIESLSFEIVSLVGINNRDLMTFEADLTTTFRLKKYIPPHVQVVSEGGIEFHKDIEQLIKHGVHAVMVGENFVMAESPGKELAK
ncbi:MAG: indole-3-glycerol phosphate synthase TrpC, partial [Ignavibacteria bacterium]|nr:indole-3-glycerol phosphate synthase TrpC [Ignavibacteria bacterium]